MRIFPPPHKTIDRGHGRIEKREIQVAPVKTGQTNFPYAAQFIKVLRSTTDLNGNNLSQDTAYFVSSLSSERADAGYLLESIRGHWSIENSLHWVRDVIFDEDRSQIRTGSAPRVFAAMRNLVISLLRLSGVKCIASGLRKLSWNVERALELIGV
jgi:predicted transposase YbfD/YdcC